MRPIRILFLILLLSFVLSGCGISAETSAREEFAKNLTAVNQNITTSLKVIHNTLVEYDDDYKPLTILSFITITEATVNEMEKSEDRIRLEKEEIEEIVTYFNN